MKTTSNNLIFLILLSVFSTYVSAETNRYALSFRDDPATTIVIGWGGDEGTVYYGTTDHGTDYTAYPMSNGVDRIGNKHGHDRKFARLANLSPNTMYYFVIRDANGETSQRFKFRTLSDDPNQPVSYITGGDSRDGFKAFGVYVESCPSGDCLEQRREGNKLVAKIRPDFIAFNGDYVMNQITSNTRVEWNGWFDDWQLTVSDDGRMYPTMHTQGNHEDNSDMYHMFDVPQEEYYILDIHGGLLRMYFLNSELNACSDASQLNWLVNDFELHTTGGTADPRWKFVQYHIPTFAMGNGYGLVADQMSCWVNLFEQYGVKLVSESHTHITKWTYPCKANSGGTDFVLDDDGIVYIGEGQWGAPHRNLDFTGASKKPFVRAQEVFDNFFYIRVTPTETSIKSVKFENAENVTDTENNELGGLLPTNVSIWSPDSGNEIILKNEGETTQISSQQNNILNIYPNPVTTELTINLQSYEEDLTVEFYNSLGKLCFQTKKSGKDITINVDELCSGINHMYIRFKSGDVINTKVIKN